MSMLSSECDGLRNAADELQNLIDNGYNYTWPGIVNTLHYAQQGLRSAADTNWELRNKLAGTVDQREEIERLEDENAKLRELVSDMFEEIEAGGFDPMVERHGKSTVYYEEDPSWRVGISERIRELGIEVGE